MTAPTRRRTRSEGQPPPAALLLCEHDSCGEPFARQYFSGLRCSFHAPTENEIKAAAAARYRANTRKVRLR